MPDLKDTCMVTVGMCMEDNICFLEGASCVIYSMSQIVQKEQGQLQITYRFMYFLKAFAIKFYSIYNVQCIIKAQDGTVADT